MDKKVIVITGATSGIGNWIAKAYAKQGAKVYSLSRKFKEDELINFVECDITNEIAVAYHFSLIFEKEKQIDLVINNSGYGLFGGIQFIPNDAIVQQMNLNLFAMMIVNKHAYKYLLKSQGQILNIASIVAKYVVPYTTIYSASKAAVLAYSKKLQQEVKKDGITVNALIIGPVKSHFQANRAIHDDPDLNVHPTRIGIALKNLATNSDKTGLSVDVVGKQLIDKLSQQKTKLELVIGYKTKFLNFAYRFLPDFWQIKILAKIFEKQHE